LPLVVEGPPVGLVVDAAMITYPLMTPPGTWSIPRMPGLGTGGKG